MKYEIKKLEKSQVEIRVIYTQEEYDSKYEEMLAKAMATAEVKGFRKGKVPRNMFLKTYGDSKVHTEVANDFINSSYVEIVTKEDVRVVAMPEIDLLSDIEDDEWGYKAVVSVYPEIVAKDYFGLDVKKEEVNIDDEALEKEVQRNLKNHAELEIVEDAVLENGMTAVFDFCGYVNKEKFPGGEAENYELEIGSNRFIPGFEEQMVGMKVEEQKTLKVTFPEQYAEELAGKDAEFVVTVHEIKKRVLPALTDEFVQELDIPEVKTVDEWKEFLKQNLINDATEAADNKFWDDIVGLLLKNNPVFIPQNMIDEEVERKLQEVKDMAKQYQMPVDLLLKYQGVESIEQYKELITPGIKDRLHYEIVISAIINQENIQLTDEDYEKYYLTLSKDKDLEETKKQYPKDRVLTYFLMLKAHDLVVEKVKTK